MVDSVTVAVAILMIAAVTGGIGFVALSAPVSMESPAGQGTTMSLNSALFQLGSASGGAVGGVLLATGGYTLLGTGLMGFMMLSGVMVWHPAWIRIRAFRTQVSSD